MGRSRQVTKELPTRVFSHEARSPHFDSGVLSEPLLTFGGQHTHIDPKTGLALYGPYSLKGQTQPALRAITVGIVGTPSMIADAHQWIEKCTRPVLNAGDEPFTRPHFPGFDSAHPFQCSIIMGDTWEERLGESEIASILNTANYYDRIAKIVELYVQAFRSLSEREPKPHVVLCCIPQNVIDVCTVRTTRSGETKRRRIGSVERRAQEIVRKRRQLFLFHEMDPTLGIEDEVSGHENLRRAMKAEAMRFGVPTQLIWPRTLSSVASTSDRKERLQDPATRAWNFFTALYYKAGGIPWRLAEVEPNTCFVGISFYRELSVPSVKMCTSVAQTFSAAGDGYVLRGKTFDWDESRYGKTPHMDRASSAALIQDVLDLYRQQNRGALPSRIVVHKTSRFWDEELVGFRDASSVIPQKDFITIERRGIQFYRFGAYPPLRGTYVKLDSSDFILYTSGYIPYLRTYPGARAPQPIEILEHHGDTPWNSVLQEVLALTKLNWNTADFACLHPITIAFSKRIGQVLAELPADIPPRPEYRYYM